MNCERCQELAERVAWLESELGLQTDADSLERFKRAFHLSRGLASVLRALYAANGRTVTRLQLLDVLEPRNENRDCEKIVDVRASQLRRIFGKSYIETVWGHGYRLSQTGIEHVRAILEPQRVAA